VRGSVHWPARERCLYGGTQVARERRQQIVKAASPSGSVRLPPGSSQREALFCRLHRAGPARSNASGTMKSREKVKSDRKGSVHRTRSGRSNDHDRDLQLPRFHRARDGNNNVRD